MITTPLLLTPSTCDTPFETARLDALEDAADLRFADSVAQYSHAEKNREQPLSRRVTPRGNTYILLFADHFSRRADMFPVTAADLTGEGTANILVNQYISLWGCLRTILSDNGLQFCCKLSQAVHQLLGVRKKATTSSRSNCNEGVERVNHTMSQMLAMVVNERQHNWDAHLPHVQFAYNKPVNAETGLTPNKVYMARLPHTPLTAVDRTGVVGHQSLARDYLVYCDLATDRQQGASDLVRARYAFTVSRTIPQKPRRHGRAASGI